MKKYTGVFRIFAILLIVVVLGALFGWYYFLGTRNAQTNAQNTGAGYGVAAPTFEGSAGSTYENTVSTLGEPVQTSSSTSQLWEVSAVPVAGFGWQQGAAPSLYFVERSSGYVFDAQ